MNFIDFAAIKLCVSWMLGGTLIIFVYGICDLLYTYWKVKNIVASFDDYIEMVDCVTKYYYETPKRIHERIINIITNITLWPLMLFKIRSILSIVQYEFSFYNETH